MVAKAEKRQSHKVETERLGDGDESVTVEATALADGDLGKVQDLLFGRQVRTISQQLDRQQTEFNRQLAVLQTAFQTQLEAFEQRMRDEFKTLTEALAGERVARESADDKLLAGLNRSEKELSQNIADLGERANNANEALSKASSEKNKELSKELKQTRDELHGLLDEAARALQSQKVDRQQLATLLDQIAGQLKITDATPDIPSPPQPAHGGG